MNDAGTILTRLAIVVFFFGLFAGFVVFMAGISATSVPSGVVAFALDNPIPPGLLVCPILLFVFFFSGGGRGPRIRHP